MKRLLRKKRHLGEYAQYGFSVAGIGPVMTDDEQNKLLDDCISFVQSMNIGIGGAVGSKIDFFAARLCIRRNCVNCNRRFGRDRPMKAISDAEREAIVSWFVQRGVTVAAGALVDVWHHTEAEFDAAEPKL